MADLILDIEFVRGAGGKHMAVKINGVPCAYLSRVAEGVIELRPGSAPAYIVALKSRRFVSFEEARDVIMQAARAQASQMVIAI